MNIVVCIKQVPNTTEVRINPETNTLIREGVESVINPFDMYAIEEAVRLKEKFGGKVTVISMGPPQAEDALREAEAAAAWLADAPSADRALASARAGNDLAIGHALAALRRAGEARVAWERALNVLQDLASGAGRVEFEPMLAEAYLVLARAGEARRLLESLRARGYREPRLAALADAMGIMN